MKKIVPIGLLLLVAVLIWVVISLYPDWLWFDNLNFVSVFWTMLITKFGFAFLSWLLLIALIAVNLTVAIRLSPGSGAGIIREIKDDSLAQLGINDRTLNAFIVAFILAFSLVIASRAAFRWDLVLRYLYQEPFGSADPIFNLDIGYYLFSLPLFLYIKNGLLVFLFFTGILTVAWYLKDGLLKILNTVIQAEGKQVALPKLTLSPKAIRHLVFLGGIIALVLAWGFRLSMHNLVYSVNGPAFGASYADVHIKVWAFKGSVFFSLILAVILFYSAFRPKMKLIWVSFAVWVGLVLISTAILPLIIQKLVVTPNELTREAPYISYNIDFTRRAYNLNKIKEVDFPVSDELSQEDVDKSRVTIQNIRIWDERPLLRTYQQIQAIRLYYGFNDIDVDRYTIDGQYRQVMLGARELIVDQLPAQANTWVNKHLIYTHGYGLAASPVNEVTGEGLPRLWIKDLPPTSKVGLEVTRPEIYFGERTDQYVLVKTTTEEFDYPKGDKNVYTTYKGKGGVPINSMLRRFLFALEFFDPQILFTGYLGDESRIMFNRRLNRRANTIAPFLDYDRDPYIVVLEGRLFWILDAYTTSNMYPYSLRSRTNFGKDINYIRNSVKVVIDAYNGDVSYYIVDENDPIIKTYVNAFPDLLKPFEQMPEGLKKHMRYPKDLFRIQAYTYTTYHMDNVQVFYNQEDLWQIPDELYGDQRQEMDPYYITMKLPEEEREEYLLMLPFSPSRKDNMIGWLAARNDMPNYGNLVVYKLPKEKLVYGPMQIEARIDQQTEISKELSLWGQGGSRVIRGNLLAIPIGDSFIYVEPIYLEADQAGAVTTAPAATQRPGLFGARSKTPAARSAGRGTAALPELKRVIVAHSNLLTMAENLNKALSNILGRQILTPEEAESLAPEDRDVYQLGQLAYKRYNMAQERLREGNWAAYGQELGKLESILKELSTMAREKK
ncbi:MAG: UPF0182 family protein [Deltaproteobacteria bacterium]|nr:UPF0182 family protein [Deltaproteobacteria bacterium]